ncbi:MAG: hypothetical protein KBI24_00620 [Selenomonas sp.]|nr:hypothetical protein [Selenomonas sp.]
MTTLPDSMSGALILSGIDFLLSFIFISCIGIVLYFFPKLNKLGEITEKKN